MAISRVCSIPDCGKRVKARGVCGAHYFHLSKAGLGQPLVTKKGVARAFADDAAKSSTDECILWPYDADRDGYGRFSIGQNGKVTRHRAHRYVCEMVNGPPKEGDFACHSCDIPTCINPRHLRWGTHQFNAEEAVARNLYRVGEHHGGAKITEEIAKAIIATPSSVTNAELSRAHGITDRMVSFIRRGKSWRHLHRDDQS